MTPHTGKTILHVMPIIPCPLTTGGNVLIASGIRALHDDFTQHVISYFGSGQTLATAEPLHPYLRSLTVLPGSREPFTAEPATPWAVNHHYSPAMEDAIRQALASHQPDLVQFDFWFMAQYMERIPELRATRTAALAVDLEYARRAGMRPEENDVPAGRYRDWELRLLGQVDHVLTVCDRDRDLLRHELPRADIRIHPFHAPAAPQPDIDPEFAITFVGAFDHQPNTDGIIRFADAVWPVLRQRHPALKCYVVGRKPPPAVQALQARDADIIVTGTVPETGPYLQRALLAVAPLYSGSGIKTKIIEALGYGIPVVTTPVGEEGLAGAPGMLVGRSDAELAGQISRCLDDGQLRRTLGEAGRAFYEEQFSYAVFARHLRELYRGITG